MHPVGLFGELMRNARVFGVTAAAIASKSGRKPSSGFASMAFSTPSRASASATWR